MAESSLQNDIKYFCQITMNAKVFPALSTASVRTRQVVFYAHVVVDIVEMDFSAKVMLSDYSYLAYFMNELVSILDVFACLYCFPILRQVIAA